MKTCNTCEVQLVEKLNWGAGAIKIGNKICLACNAAKARNLWAKQAPQREIALAAKRAATADIDCGTCGVPFKPKMATAKFCSDRCMQRSGYIKRPFNPETFGTGTTANRGRKQSEGHVEKRTRALMDGLKSKTRQCIKCGGDYTPTAAAQKYCSGRCWNAVARAKKEKKQSITIHADHYAALLAMQDGKCKICGTASGSNGRGDKLAVDHCHSSGNIRGLLCHKCNTAIGLLKDSTSNLHAAITYLNEAAARK